MLMASDCCTLWQMSAVFSYLPLTFEDEAQTALFKDPVHTALKTLFFSVIKTDEFILCGAEVAVCSQINTKHINTLWTERAIVEF
jgi:hypothetical protein